MATVPSASSGSGCSGLPKASVNEVRLPLDRATCKPGKPLTIVPALQAATAALDKASRLAHADRKRNLSEHNARFW